VRLSISKKALPDQRFDRETSEFDRSLGFFDATYAFALTLLILNIDLPPAADWQSFGALVDAVSWQLIGFLTSFVVIILFWLSNNGIISRLRTLDSVTIVLNICVLAFVIFIPFTTQAISEPDLTLLPLPTIVYAINVAAAILTQALMYEVAMSRGYGRVDRSPRTRRLEIIDGLANPAVFLFSIPVTLLFGTIAGKLTWALMIPLGILTGRPARRAELADLEAQSSRERAADEQTPGPAPAPPGSAPPDPTGS
jgi:uncharacterized membrane protein